MDKIFINIAAYRDPTITYTIKEALEKAKNPERLIFGIGLQYYDYEMPDLSFIPENQLKILNYEVDNRPGLVKIRSEISNMFTNEDYFLMIDSHSEFSNEWDKTIVDEYLELKNILKQENFVFSGLRMGKTLCADFRYAFFHDYPTSIWYETVGLKQWNKNKNVNGATCSSFFAPAKFLKNVGFDQHSHFLLEEPYLAWRIHMSGWNVYVPEKTIIRQSFARRSKYIEYAWSNDYESDRFESKDSESDKVSMFISMLTNLPGKYSIANSNIDPLTFFNNALDFNRAVEVKHKIFKINEIVNGDRNHPINEKLIDSYLLMSKYY